MQKKRRLIIAAIAAAVIALVIYGFMPKAVPADLAAVKRGLLIVAIKEEGRTRVVDRYVVSAPVAGYLKRVTLEAGDEVKKGDTLFTLEPLKPRALDARTRTQTEARVKTAEASLKAAKEKVSSAKIEVENAATDFERVKSLYESKYATKEAFDNADSRVKRASADKKYAEFLVEAAKSELEEAKAALSEALGNIPGGKVTIVKSPISGQILKLRQESEGPVTEGQPILELGDPGKIEVVTDILTEDALKIKPGTPVVYEHWGGETSLKGVVTRKESGAFTKLSTLGVEEQRIYVISDIQSPAETWTNLGDGFRVETNFILSETKSALITPESSIFKKDSGFAVFVKDGSKARLREVKIGKRNGLSAEVLEGLSEGDFVITHPSDAIKDGVKIKSRTR